MYRQNLMRMLGGLIWVMIPIIALMLFLPHDVQIDYEMTFIFMFVVIVVNFSTTLLPFKEALLSRYFDLLMSLYSISLIALICAGIHYTGGINSPLFTFLLLITAFCTSLFSSLKATALLSGFSVGAYFVTLSIFSGVVSRDTQLLCTQIFFILLLSFFVNRLSVESREQLQERSKAVEELRALSQMDRAASSFVSAVSFEMRTPLTSILGFSEMLVSRRFDPDKEQEYVKIISREADNLSRLVEDLLDISRLESGKVQLNKEVTRLGSLLNLSLPILEPVCEPERVILNIPPDLPSILVDPQRMKRVFDAIFGYVVKRSGKGSEIRASAKAEGQVVMITLNIRNQEGAGIHENGRIFPPLGGPDEDDLELAMARRIVLAHRGSINLVQASGGWFTIVLRLPQLVAKDFVLTPSSPFSTFEETSA